MGTTAQNRACRACQCTLRRSLMATGRVLGFITRTALRLNGTPSALKAVRVDLDIPLGSVGIVSLKNRTI
jgi:hypothetical protein